MTVSTAFANSSLDASLTGTYYVGLLVSGTEVSTTSTGYARQSFTFSAAASASKANSADIVFPTATAGWGTINGFALYSAVTGGSALVTGSVSPTVTINSGNQYKFSAGALTITES